MNKLIIITASLLALLLMGISCDSMNDIQAEFADRDETVYLGKVDSLKVYPGFGRAKITWYVSADPKIEKTVIYWNMRQDSIVKDFTRTTSGIQKDSIIIEDMGENALLYEFRNINSKGESSLYSSITVTAWGENFASNLLARRLVSREYDYEQSQYTLNLTDAMRGDSVAYSQVLYTDINGGEKNVRIERNVSTVILPDFGDGMELQFRNVFFLPLGMDTVYGTYQTYKSPVATFDAGKKLSIGGNVNNRYFQRDGKILYEWTEGGDLIEYTVNEDGSYTLNESYPALAPKTSFRGFFFYDDDKFISISAPNDALVQMWRLVNGQLILVPRAGDNAISFGSGFRMDGFIPTKGIFYTYSNGALRTWFANNNATWGGGSINGATVASNKNLYSDPIVVYNYRYIVTVDPDGYLWSIPISTIGVPTGLNKIGKGWDKFVHLACVGTKLLALDANGDLYEFDFDAEEKYWIID